MVEKANDIIKRKTIKITQYSPLEEMNDDLIQFLVHYKLYRRNGSLRKELKVKTPFNALEKWYSLDPEIFNQKPEEFKKHINLRCNFSFFYQKKMIMLILAKL